MVSASTKASAKSHAALVLAAALFALSACSAKPTKTFHIVNTGAEPRSITLQLVKEDGSVEDLYTLDKALESGKQVWEQVPSGEYFASVWNAQDKLVQELETVDALLADKKSDFNPIVIDLALDKNYAVANINYLYEGGAFADIVSEAFGSDQGSLEIVKFLDGAQAFELEARYRASADFVDILASKVPKSVAAAATVYALVPIPAEIREKPKAYEAVHRALLAKLPR